MPEKKAITLFMVGSVALITFDNLVNHKAPEPGQYMGAFLSFIMLSFLGDIAPQIAGPLAALVFFSIMFSRGGSLAKVFQ